MNAKIDRNGILKVERAGEMKTQCCPYTPTRPRVFKELIYYVQNADLFRDGYLAKLKYTDASENYTSYCGDWCPKFEEVPENAKLHLSYRVKVCGGPTYEIIADERPKGAAHAQE